MIVLLVLILAIAPTKRRGVMSSIDRDGPHWDEIGLDGGQLFVQKQKSKLLVYGNSRLSESLEVDEGRKEGG